MSDHKPSKTDQVPITPMRRQSLTDPALEPLLRTDLSVLAAGGEVALEWSKLPVSAHRYAIGERFADGGMGNLYLATDKVLGRRVAIKVLRRLQMDDPTAVVRFLQEARIHAQFHHAGIPPLHDVGRLPDGRPFLAIKHIRGRTLATRPTADDWKWSRAVFEQLCRVMAYAHAKGVIHRDLTPSNVLVSDRGRVQVIDWGLAKVLTTPLVRANADAQEGEGTTQMSVPNLTRTDEGIALGTPAYMAPELTDGSAVASEQSDVFGLGSILCHLLTGRPPYSGQKSSVVRQLKAGDLTAAYARLDACDAPPDLVSLAKRCLSRDLTERPRSASALVFIMGEGSHTTDTPSRSWLSKLFGRKRT